MKRGTGKTTIQILKALAEAIENPGKKITFEDHWAYFNPKVTYHTLQMMGNIIYNLNLNISFKQVNSKIELISNHYGVEIDKDGRVRNLDSTKGI